MVDDVIKVIEAYSNTTLVKVKFYLFTNLLFTSTIQIQLLLKLNRCRSILRIWKHRIQIQLLLKLNQRHI